MLRDHSDCSQPFFLAVGFWRPHLPFVAPKRYWDLYDAKTIPMPNPAQSPDSVPEIAMHASREIRGYGHVAKDRDFTEDEIRHYRHGYYASISFLDTQIGEILDALKSSDLANNTVIVFTSDHGFHIGEHTLWGKTSNFELDARVPLIISAPDHPKSYGKTTAALAELVDLYPTLASFASIADDLPKNLDGVSLEPILVDPSATVKDAAFTQHQQPFYGSSKNWEAWGRSIRTEQWRYTEWRGIKNGDIIARELYDHDSDPKETRNLAVDANHQDTINGLATSLGATFVTEPSE
jgi:iduronate 2-sulfatase